MKPTSATLAAIAVALLFVATAGSGCIDLGERSCTSDDDCRYGRLCVEGMCAAVPGNGAPLGDDAASAQDTPSRGDTPPRQDASSPDATPVEPQTPDEAMVEAYCNTESECIDRCVVRGGEAACDSSERQSECRQDFGRWYEGLVTQSQGCAQTVDAWIECISQASCGEVEEFFESHPDGVSDSTPCSSVYFKMECIDFEPPTEYAFE